MRAQNFLTVGLLVALLPASTWAGAAYADGRAHRPLHASHLDRHHREAISSGRSLTVKRLSPGRFAYPYVGAQPSAIGADEADAYGDVAKFNPAPYVTSGLQFPFGLDGIGGFGSDLGFDAGESGSVYQR